MQDIACIFFSLFYYLIIIYRIIQIFLYSTSLKNSPLNISASRNTEAPFVRTLEKLWTLEKKIAGELEMLSDLKKQIREVIEAVPDTDERMVLKYRYIHNYTWEQIGMELCADARTIRRWHGKALLHVTLPDDPIII